MIRTPTSRSHRDHIGFLLTFNVGRGTAEDDLTKGLERSRPRRGRLVAWAKDTANPLMPASPPQTVEGLASFIDERPSPISQTIVGRASRRMKDEIDWRGRAPGGRVSGLGDHRKEAPR